MRQKAKYGIPVILSLVVAMAPHAPGLPLWINAWCMIMWGAMLARLKAGRSMPGPLVRHGLTFTGLAGLVMTFRFPFGADAFVGLMAVMAGIKPFETATHRHRMITLLLAYFIIITSLFRSDSLWILIHMFLSVLVTTAALVRINDLEGRVGSSIAMACRIMGRALPLMVLLFLLFPRLQDGFFGIKEKPMGVAGFSEKLTPGSVAGLARDMSTAFRVRFDAALPSAGALYWRGIVFERFDGRSWLPPENPEPDLVSPAASQAPGPLVHHTIFLEPHHSQWLFGLDIPVRAGSHARLTSSCTLRSPKKISRKKIYRVVSVQAPALKGEARPISIPRQTNPLTRDLARRLTKDAMGPQEKIRKILDHFKTQNFVYSLSPGRSPDTNSLDYFLTKSKKGYCEHYASAFVFMMNQVRVPARVVGGYLGGEFNPYGNLLTVRQASAHAWAEVFVQGRGWIRVDPTLAVVPERAFENPDGSSSRAAAPDRLPLSMRLRYMMEAVNLKWETWFTGYSLEGQRALLRRLGIGSGLKPSKAMLLLMAGTGMVLVLFTIWLVRIHRAEPHQKDRVKKAYLLFLERLTRAGLPEKKPGQGPVDYAGLAGSERPDLEKSIQALTALYVRIRFARTCPAPLIDEFEKKVHRFRPKKQPSQNPWFSV